MSNIQGWRMTAAGVRKTVFLVTYWKILGLSFGRFRPTEAAERSA